MWILILVTFAGTEPVWAYDTRAECEAALIAQVEEKGFTEGVPNCEEGEP